MGKKIGWGIISFISVIAVILGITILQHKQSQSLKAATLINKGEFRLNVSNLWDKEANKVAAKLDWDEIDNLTQKGYRMYQSEDSGTTWDIRSLNYGKKVTVLNIFPNLNPKQYPTASWDDSNAFKSWMKDLNLKDKEGNELIEVTPVANDDFNVNPEKYLKDSSGEWKYNVITLGTWDRNGHAKVEKKAANCIMDFINDGGGVLFGHDTIAADNSVAMAENEFMEPFADKLGITYGFNYTGSISQDQKYWTGSDEIQLVNDGYLMKYPFEMKENVVLTIPPAHSIELQNKDIGEVWFEFNKSDQVWGASVYDNGKVRNNWYLKTNENVAMIQTGHSKAQATIDEEKIIANTLYNLAQISIDAYADDQSVTDDVAPGKPELNKVEGNYYDFNVEINSVDDGKKYQWYIEADSKNKGLLQSDVMKETIISNIAGYFYRMDESEQSELAKEVESYKDNYGRIPKDKFDLYVAPTSDEVVYDTSSKIEGLHGDTDSNKYLHVVAVDRANNISEVSTVKVSDFVEAGDFNLTAKNAWDKDSNKNYAELNWDEIQNLSQKGYQVFQSEDGGEEWERIPVLYDKQVNVLNVYPNRDESNNFKKWMESLNMKTDKGEELIKITPVAANDFNKEPEKYLKSSDGQWKYDVFMYGTWDSNSNSYLTEESVDYIVNFLNDGKGALFGHDTLIWTQSNPTYYQKLTELLGVSFGDVSKSLLKKPWPKTWNASEKIKLINDGYLMKYPFEFEKGAVLEIPYAHNVEVQDKNIGEVWFEFESSYGSHSGASDFIYGGGEFQGMSEKETDYVYEDERWKAGWYLKTNGNIGMTQTGHSNGAATIQEKQLLANTLYNLAQVSIDTVANVQTVKDDVAPEIPNITFDSGSFENFSLKVDSVDKGKPYEWYVEANTKNNGVLRSNIAKEEIISNTAGYFYSVDSKEATDLRQQVIEKKDDYGRIPVDQYDLYVAPKNSSATTYDTSSKITGLNGAKDADQYLHVVAVDRANNVSEVNTIKISELMTEFQITEKFIDDFGKEIQKDNQQLIKKNGSYTNLFPEIAGYDKYGYQVDSTEIVKYSPESKDIVIPNIITNHTLSYIYMKPVKLHMRQVVLPSNNASVAIPAKGDSEVWNTLDHEASEVITKRKFDINSGLKDVNFTTINFEKEYGYNYLYLKVTEPSFYEYEGAVVTQDDIPHDVSNKINDFPTLSLEENNEYWVTMYLKPVVNADVYLNIVNNKLNVYYANINKFTVYIDGERYKEYHVSNKPVVESQTIDLPVSEIRNKLTVKYTNLEGKEMNVYWNNSWDFVK
ncbi:hypothetical protein GWG83_002506 [Enterococcus faecalis]|nr:hypothetical protein [Enterococcus faecalis]